MADKVILKDRVTKEEMYPVTHEDCVITPIEVVSGETIAAKVGRYYRFDEEVNTLNVTLPTIGETDKLSSVVLSFTTGNTPKVTITADADIAYLTGYFISPNTTYELNLKFNGNKWIVDCRHNGKEVVVFTTSINYKNPIVNADGIRNIDPAKQVFYLVDNHNATATVIPLSASCVNGNNQVAFVGIYYPVNNAGIVKFVRFSTVKSTYSDNIQGIVEVGDLTPTWQSDSSGGGNDDNYYYEYALIGNFDEDIPVVTNNLDSNNTVEIK